MREFSVPASFTVGEHDNIVSSVFSHERDDPDHVIFQRLVDGAWTDVTCKQAADQIRSAALGLIAEGVAPGDRVAVLSATRYEWPILDFAILAAGAVTVPIYETQLRRAGAVRAGGFRRRADLRRDRRARRQDRAPLLDELPALRKVLRIDGSGTPALDALAEAGKSVDAKQLDDRLAGMKSTDPATLIYTSGTTGRPKGCQLTHSNLLYEIRGAKDCFPTPAGQGRTDAGVPAAGARAGARASPSRRSRTRSRSASPATSRTWCRRSGSSSRPWWCRCRGCSRRSTTPPNRTPATTARAGSSQRAANTAIEWSKAQDTGGAGLLLRAKHALFDRLVYGKLRAALGGNCRGAISGGAPLGARLGHFYRGVGPDHLRGLRPHRDQRRDHGEPDRRREGRFGRKAVARQQHAPRRRRRAAGQGRRGVRRLLAQRRRRPRRCSPTAGSTPATSAPSTTTAS